MNEISRPFNLFRLVEDALADLGDASRIRRLVPVAWPILEVEHTLRIRLEESINLVERHVLEAIARFGPVAEPEICDWMGIQPAVLQHVLAVLDRFPEVISRADGLLTAADGTLERCEQERWGRDVIQKLAFFVNGPIGRLAPIAINSLPQRFQLKMEFAGNSGKVTNRSGQELDQVYWVAASQSDASQEISRLLQGLDSKLRSEVGIPDGAYAMESMHGSVLGERWILALGTLSEDGQFVVRPAGFPSLALLALSKQQLTNFEPLLRRGDRNGFGLFDLREDKTTERETPHEWQEHAECEAVGSKLTIRLRNPSTFDHWPLSKDDNDDKSRVDLRNSSPVMPQSLWITIGRPYTWHPYYFSVRKVVPGDVSTAEIMLKQRALIELEKLADLSESSFDLRRWWKAEQEKIGSTWPVAVRPPMMPAQEITKIARRSPNPDLVELVLENS